MDDLTDADRPVSVYKALALASFCNDRIGAGTHFHSCTRQIVAGLVPHPEIGVRPASSLQTQGHISRNSAPTVEHAVQGRAGHTQFLDRTG